MKIIFEYDTDSESYNRSEVLMHTHAIDMYCALLEIQKQVREWYKYDQRTQIPDEEVRNTINGIIADHVNMDEFN